MLQMLEGMADDDGLLPPWTDWWPPEEVDRLFPDPGTKHRIAGEVQRVPLDYFRRSVPAPAKWTQLPCAYVSFGATYAAEAQHADELGWPTRLLDGLHLHSVVAPDDVARTVAGLIGVAP
jgi:hypothetical protein